MDGMWLCVTFTLLAAGVAARGSVLLDGKEVEKTWIAFKEEYKREYRDLDEEQYRRDIFEKQLQAIYNHRLKYDRGDVSWYMGINQFSDWDDLDHRAITCVLKNHERTKYSVNDTDALYESLGSPPDEINWKTKGKVHSYVSDQIYGVCGGCYAFAATAATESHDAIKYKREQKKILGLSEQQIIDCGYKYACRGCQGGHPCSAYDEVIGDGGFDDFDEYPFRQPAKQGHNHKCMFEAKHVRTKIAKYYEGTSLKDPEKALHDNVGLAGPTTVSICESKSFKAYGGGVYNDADCIKVCTDKEKITHSMTTVGYTKDVWIIKNSYGKKWGEEGYVRMAKTKKGDMNTICYLGYDQSYPFIK